MSKPTMRKSGERRVTLRVRQDLSLKDLAHLVWRASSSGYGIQSHGFPRNPAAIVRTAVTAFLKYNGNDEHPIDDESYTGSGEAQRWAYEHAALAFGFDASEIPEPKVDEHAARRLAFFDAGGHPEDLDDEGDCEADHAEYFRA